MTAPDAVLHLERETVVHAAPNAVRRLVADVSWWPLLFSATVHVEVLERRTGTDRLRIWAFDENAHRAGRPAVRTWTTTRRLLPDTGTAIVFAQDAPQAPLAAMGGEWRFEPREDGGCRLVLAHHARVSEGTLADHPWIAAMVTRTADAQLAAVKAAAELGRGLDEAVVTAGRAARFRGRAAEAAEALADADRWPLLLPQLAGLRVGAAGPHAWLLERSGRPFAVCVAPVVGRLVVKQLAVSRSCTALTGEWTVRPATDLAGSEPVEEVLVTLRRRGLTAARGAARRRLLTALTRDTARLVRQRETAGV
ncbi:aromatase/cyclase [Kitasatospora sp. NPDC087314]|uniref:aromatase/cyclase n=1 Tax=Kitasatospora sp. NPDC087314 TaxID=3364068 RepID=UPI00380F0A6F